jgi:pimeloyl-ACP methyl ester carboxylesterase
MRTPTRLVLTSMATVLAVALLPGSTAFTADPSPSPTAASPTSAPPSNGPIRLSPVTDPTFGLSAVVPSDWTNQGHGIYSRAATADDPSDRTLLALQSAPLTAEKLWPTLQQQLGIAAAPLPLGSLDTAAGLHWNLYHVDVETPSGTLGVDLGLAEDSGKTYIVLLQTDKAESAALHDSVFIPVINALAPAAAPSPSEAPTYQSLDVTFPGGASDVTLAGTLTLPAGDGPFPAVVLLSGSGPQDRDESLGGVTALKPFAEIANALSQAGIAVLRFDDRGTGQSTGDFSTAGTGDFTKDGAAAIAYLRSRPDIDFKRIGVLGHSEGGIEAASLAASDPNLDFVVSMAGPAVKGIDLITAQVEAINRADGASEADVAKSGAAEHTILAAALTGNQARTRKALTTVFGKVWDTMTPDQQKQAGTRKAYVNQQVAATLPTLMSPGFQAILKSNPGPDWRTATVPVLGLYGGKDTQVPADQNAPALAAELGTGARALSTIVVLPDANHLFQSAKTGSPSEYGSLDAAFTPEFLPTLVDWVKARTSDVVPPSSEPSPSEAPSGAPSGAPSEAPTASEAPSASASAAP